MASATVWQAVFAVNQHLWTSARPNNDTSMIVYGRGKRYCTRNVRIIVNPLILTLTPQSNGPLCSNAVIGTLAVDGWSVTFGTARRDLGGLGPRPVLSSLYQM